jgi:hypothetical protein
MSNLAVFMHVSLDQHAGASCLGKSGKARKHGRQSSVNFSVFFAAIGMKLPVSWAIRVAFGYFSRIQAGA